MSERPSDQAIMKSGDETVTGSARRGRILRQPTAKDIEDSTITAFMRWLRDHRALAFADYAELWEWSIREPEQFWSALWDYFKIETSAPYEAVRRGTTIRDTDWFPGARLNFAQHLLRHERRLADQPAILCHSEDGASREWSWSELGNAVRRLATQFRAMGIQPGDRIAGYLPNTAEAAISLLAATAIGAIWSSCSPEFGVKAALDRFGQIEPKVLIAVPRYRYAGKVRDRSATVDEIVAGLPTVSHLVVVSNDEPDWRPSGSVPNVISWAALLETPAPSAEEFRFEALPTDHPLWIVYTSGTSGPPKAVVHSHGGALLGAMKDLGFHIEVTEKSRLFFYSTTSWIVWNLMLGGLSLGASVVLYDGSPFEPDIGRLWSIAEQTKATVLGTSPGFIAKMIDKDYRPSRHHTLDALEVIVLAGAIAEDTVCDWLAAELPPHTRTVLQAGSTEICGGYSGGVRLLPFRSGEITARVLGMDVEAFDKNMNTVRGEMGELVIRTPFPNAPQCLWNDPDGARFVETYLSEIPGMWRQGDIITIFADGACRISGRSDATINRNGVRMGSNELYRALADEPRIADAIAVCPQAGRFNGQLLLFVQMAGSGTLDDKIHRDIARTISDTLSPRHVPDLIVQAPAVPYTVTGKRIEVQLRELLDHRITPEQFAMTLQHDPDTAAWYTAFASAGTA
ncbi:MAG: acetoacetate--CoA ligase [Novosphingobium sp.]